MNGLSATLEEEQVRLEPLVAEHIEPLRDTFTFAILRDEWKR